MEPATPATGLINDQDLELIIGEAQWSDQLADNVETLDLEWAIDNPEHGMTDVHFGNYVFVYSLSVRATARCLALTLW